MQKGWFWWISVCVGVVLVTVCVKVRPGMQMGMHVCYRPVYVSVTKRKREGECCCLHVNNSISKLSLDDRESRGLHGMSFSSVLPNQLPLFSHSLFREHKMAHNGILNKLWELILFSLSPLMHPQSVHSAVITCCEASVQMSAWHFTFPFHYFIFNPHLIIPLPSKAFFVSLSVSYFHFSLWQ